jgi:dinuclear metal center YbgI/SA1388 family protein
MTSDAVPTVGALAVALEAEFPLEWAEGWDRVGLIAGDGSRPVSGVLVTLDATAEAVERAASAGANVLVTHHPPYLEAPVVIAPGPGPSGTLEAALRLGVALIAHHTNLDRSPAGASALTRALGLEEIAPLEASPESVVVVTTFAPATAARSLRDAMAAAGAGRLGDYETCAFEVPGTGWFEPRSEAVPVVEGGADGAAELRLEMVASPARASAVLDAARAAHPYEEPLILAIPGSRARGRARLGRIATWPDGATLKQLAEHVATTLGVSCRVWGEPEQCVKRIAVANGSASSLISDAGRGADVLIAGEVRYHDALVAVAAGLAIIEAGHDATEWPIVGVLADAVRAASGDGVDVVEESSAQRWWTVKEPHVRG